MSTAIAHATPTSLTERMGRIRQHLAQFDHGREQFRAHLDGLARLVESLDAASPRPLAA